MAASSTIRTLLKNIKRSQHLLIEVDGGREDISKTSQGLLKQAKEPRKQNTSTSYLRGENGNVRLC